MVPTPDILGGSNDIFGDFSNDNTINDDEVIKSNISHIPKSPHSSIYGPHTSHGRLPDGDELYEDDDVQQFSPFDPNRYPDGAHGSIYTSPPSVYPKTQNHDHKHQKKKLLDIVVLV